MLELLPDDLQYRIISQLPWTSIPSAALCCRSWANLVRRRHSSSSCSPQWSQALVRGETSNRHVAEQASENCFAFVNELLTSTGYLAKPTRPDVVIVTATLYWQPHLKSIQEKILEVLPNSKSVHVLCLVASVSEEEGKGRKERTESAALLFTDNIYLSIQPTIYL